ncbi:MAG: hypothetical protein ACRD0V_17360, partial [Acidimicrobiales bacterium]
MPWVPGVGPIALDTATPGLCSASGICPAAGSTGMVIERDRGYRPLLLLEFEGRPRPRTHRTGG